MSTITVETVISAYTQSRLDIKALEDQIDAIKEKQRRREEWLLTQLTQLGAQNLKTSAGTVYQTLKESITVADWDAVIDFVLEPLYEMGGVDPVEVKKVIRLEFLTKGVSKVCVLETMGDKRDQPPIPGCNYVATRTVGIRKG